MDTKQELIEVKPTVNDLEVTIPKPQALAVNPDAPLMVQVMQMAASGITLDTDMVKAMQDIVRQQKADDAKEAYAAGFTLAQADIGGVVKTRKNQQTNSMYAGLDDVIEMSKTVCAKHGFSIAFSEGVPDKVDHIRVCATVLHKAGHPEPYHYDVPLGGKGIKGVVNMTAIHAKATSVSYGQRYLLCMIWNIPTKDTDGNPPPAPPQAPVMIPQPNEAEAEVIKLICHALPHVAGMTPSPEKIGILCYCADQVNPHYYQDARSADAVCAWLLKEFQDTQIYEEVK